MPFLIIPLVVVAAVQAAKAQEQQARAQQAMSQYNAALQEQQAKQIEAKTLFDQTRNAQEAERQKSSLTAGLGMSGAVTTEGSPLLIQAKQASESELDNVMIGYEGGINAQSARSQGTLDTMQAGIYGQRANNAMTSGYMNAGTSLLQGFDKAGTFDSWGKKQPMKNQSTNTTGSYFA